MPVEITVLCQLNDGELLKLSTTRSDDYLKLVTIYIGRSFNFLSRGRRAAGEGVGRRMNRKHKSL